MSIFTVEISPSQVTSVEIETTVGQNPSHIDIITSSAVNLEITNSVALLPSDFNSNVDSRLFSVINSGSGINIAYDINQPSITISSTINNSISSTISGLQSQIDNKQPVGNYATLINGLIPPSQLPSYVDDILEYNNLSSFPISGESGKIYISLDNSKVYRWGGTSYIEISASPGSSDSVPEGSTNKYYTDARASAAAPVQSVSGKTGTVTLNKNDVNLGNVDNTSDTNKPISTAVQTALDSKASLIHNHVSNNISDATSFGKNILTAASYAGINDLLWEVPATTGSPSTFTASNGGHYYIPPTLMSLIKFNDPIPISGINGDFYRVCSFDSNIILNIGNISYTNSGGIDIVRAYSTITSSWETIAFNNHTHAISNVTGLQTALDTKAPLASPTFTGTVNGITKSMVGLGNADNTSDANKPVSTATQTALDGKAATSHVHAIGDVTGLQTALDNKQASGSYATLTDGKVPSSQLPSYVDDVIEVTNLAALPVSGETGKIYVTLDSNKTYRWSGSAYVEISASPGSTDSVTEGSINQYYTDARASAAAPVQSVSGRIGIVTLTKNDVGLSNVDNTSDINKPISTSVQNALDLKSNSGHSHASSNITDFNSSVSGLLPVKDILSGQYVDVSANSGSYTISVSGLQPSGNYSTVGHSHSYTDITNFASGVDNAVSTALLGGNYIRLNYDNLADTLTISATGLQPSGNYSLVGHSHVISDVSGLQTALDNKQPSGSYASLVHNHLVSDITDFVSGVSGLLPVKQLVAGSNVSITNTDGIYTIQSTVSTPSGVLEASRQLVNYNISTDIVGSVGISLEYIYIFNTGSENAGLTLSTAVDNKSVYTLKNNTLGTIYLKTTGSETIDGYDSIGLNRRYSSISVISDGLNWIIV
jgi:hypothetical protein